MEKENDLQLKTIADVRRFLEAEGYTAAHSTVDRHFKQGKFGRNTDGLFDVAALKLYAAANLKRIQSGKTMTQEQQELQDARERAKLELIEEQVKTARLKRRREEGQLIDRNNVMLEIAARAGVLESQFKSSIQSGVLDLIDLVKGNPERAADLMRTLNQLVDEVLTEYANMDPAEVVFDAE
ncbi:hypothetical protein [Desulfovibrio oxyclinae]|uniref:hypothetical protein n=1 Tax=Desulfovibrio oxyclinae TaxID=63560 RepID=UPI00036C02B8|nr:hypothetical protein [Desulfovibrio oxyclinae]